MIILGIDTSCGRCSAAIYDGKKVLHETIETIHKQAEQIAILIKTVLDKANIIIEDIDAIAVTKGPGSFTGIRIGISIAQGIAAVINKPIVGVTTLDAIAFNSKGSITAIVDAGKGELYTQNFSNGACVSEIRLLKISDLEGKKLIGVYKEHQEFPSAENIAKIAHNKLQDGNFIIEPISPLYIREPDAVVKLSQ